MSNAGPGMPDAERDRIIFRTGFTGILANLLLSAFKAAVGVLSHSIAVVLDAVNNLSDAVLSASVLATAVVFTLTGVSLEAYVGALISVFIIRSGIRMMAGTLNEILGKRADKETTARIMEILTEDEAVRGAYDLILYNYGPSKNYASVHLELPDTMTVREVDKLTRKLEGRVYRETGVIMAGVGLYSYDTGNDEAARIRNDVRERVLAYDWALQFHGFSLDIEDKEMAFDVVMSFDIRPDEGLRILYGEMCRVYPDYRITISPDVDVSVTD